MSTTYYCYAKKTFGRRARKVERKIKIFLSIRIPDKLLTEGGERMGSRFVKAGGDSTRCCEDQAFKTLTV